METKIKTSVFLHSYLGTRRQSCCCDVGYHDMELIDRMQSVPDLERALCDVLSVDLPEPKKGVLLELYVQTVLFCREHDFTKEQISAALSIIKSVHEANIETPLNNSEQTFRYCDDLLLCHSVRRPPFSIDLFSLEEATRILSFIQDQYLRHYRLYKYIFTPQVKLDLFLTYSGMEDVGSSATEDSFAAGCVTDMKEDETNPKQDESSETQEEDGPTDLKSLVEREVRLQMQQISGKLEQRVRESASELNGRTLVPKPKPNSKNKK